MEELYDKIYVMVLDVVREDIELVYSSLGIDEYPKYKSIDTSIEQLNHIRNVKKIVDMKDSIVEKIPELCKLAEEIHEYMNNDIDETIEKDEECYRSEKDHLNQALDYLLSEYS